MILHPVGFVKSDIKTPELKANTNDLELQIQKEQLRKNHQAVKNNICELVIFPKFESLLDGIEDFSHILVLYWLHLIDPEKRKLQKIHHISKSLCATSLSKAQKNINLRWPKTG
jgi:tRNA (Thr-GGU) A37 N-methylase